jgi:hypothetical protein
MGAIASPSVDGEVWAHFSNIDGKGYKTLLVGQPVSITYATPGTAVGREPSIALPDSTWARTSRRRAPAPHRCESHPHPQLRARGPRHRHQIALRGHSRGRGVTGPTKHRMKTITRHLDNKPTVTFDRSTQHLVMTR